MRGGIVNTARAGAAGAARPAATPRRFTPAEDATLIALFRKGRTLRQIGAALGRDWAVIQQRVRILMRRGELGYGNRSRRPWTVEQDQELRGLLGWQSLRAISRTLGRSETAIKIRAKRLGYSWHWKGAYTARGVGVIFAVDAKTVSIWIRDGLIEARKTGRGRTHRWRIEHEAIEAFIRDGVPYYERRRITEPYWRNLADQAWQAFGLVSLTVAARRLGVCDETLKRRIRRGEWQAEQVVCGGGFAYMVRASDLERFQYLKEPVPMIYAKGHRGAIRKAEVTG